MSYKLTDSELSWLDNVFTQVNEELRESVSKLGQRPLAYTLPDEYERAAQARTRRLSRGLRTRAHAEDFIALEALGRVRLSKQTRQAELKRLKRKHVPRKKYTFRYGRKHNKLIAQTKARHNEKRWANAPLERLRHTSRKPVRISQEDWDRCIAPVWNRYDRKYLKIKGTGDSYTIHNMMVEYHPPREKWSRSTPRPVVVYNGLDQAVYDAMMKK